jgi:hypothetical protein
MSLSIGVAQTDITPEHPVWLAGYGDRDKRSEGVYQPLRAGAIYLGGGDEVLLIPTDMFGFDLSFAAQARQRIAAACGMLPHQIVLTATHTHTGPLFYPMNMPGEPELGYAAWMCEKLVELAVVARSRPVAGTVSFSRTRSQLGVNRRLLRDGVVAMAPNPDGPIDRDLDTLWFENDSGQPLATLTVYGCHPTSLAGYLIGGDYPGFLCRAVEEQTQAPAFFSTGCAGDVRPWYKLGGADFPRPQVAGVEAAGRAVAQEVLDSKGSRTPVDAGGLAIADGFHLLPFGEVPSANDMRKTIKKENGLFLSWAVYVNCLLERGPLPTACPHEIQVLQLNDDFRLLFLGGEVLSEIGMHLKRALAPATTVTVAYSNGLIGYIPSKNAHPFGGYEVDGSHFYFSLPAPFTDQVEDHIVDKSLELVESLRGN